MADRRTRKLAPPPSAPAQAGAASQRKAKVSLFVLMAVLAWVILSLPTLIVFAVGLMPTFVALILDRSEEKYSTICVGAMNFAGVFPYILRLLLGAHSVGGAIEILTNPFALAVMYGAAGFGWMLFASVPPVVAAFLTVVSQRKVAALRASQRSIVEEWGDTIAKSTEAAGKPKGKAAPVAPRRARA